MDRREFLVLMGASSTAALAGCQSTGGEGTDATPETRVPTAAATPTGTGTPPPTETEDTPTPTQRQRTTDSRQTATETETEPPTNTETPTPAPGAEALATAADELQDAHRAYLEYARLNRGFEDINSGRNVESAEIRSALSDVRGPLNRAEQEDLTPDQQERLQGLQGLYWFYWYLGKIHESHHQALGRLNSSYDRIVREEFFAAEPRLEKARERVESADDIIGTLRSESDPEDAAAFSSLSREMYTSKVSQLETEGGQIRELKSVLQSFSSSFETLQNGFDEYDAEEYQSAAATFFSAQDEFTDVQSQYSETDWVAFFTPIVSDLRCAVPAIIAGTEQMQSASEAGADGNTELRKQTADAARDEFKNCELFGEDDKFPTLAAFLE